ncbi:endonuclease/exonuclease/phosphatase family protein [bacterium]|nr:endonuclease/exonuclease/phosphatase family protein [candidate division CSSED10-310 bacterium]
MEFRVGSFNVENLFDRAKVLNLADHSLGDDKMARIAQLNQELGREVYDKEKIIELYGLVKDYITFNIMRSSIGKYVIKKQGDSYVVKAGGQADWDGCITFRREKFSDDCRKNTAKVIREVGADIICMIEVENRPVMDSFNSERLNRRYGHNILIDGNDQRGIDVGVYSRFPLGDVRTNIFDGTAQSRTFSRDCLECQILLTGGRILHLLVNHFKSKSGVAAAGDARRQRQAARVNEIIDERYDLEHDLVIVAGDFNDAPDSTPLAPLLTNPRLHDVLAAIYPDQPEERWTYHYRANEQIDFILVSDPLLEALRDAGVERRGIAGVEEYTDGRINSFSTVTNWRNAASDHGAVWADFRL